MPDPGPVPAELEDIVRRALEEDVGAGDVTTACVIDRTLRARAKLVFSEHGIVAGLPAAEAAFRLASERTGAELRFSSLVTDGDTLEAGSVAASVEGPARALLSAERVALNFVSLLSGIATLTALFVRAVEGTGARILDTRKTTPLLRSLEKYAVRAGGGLSHRMGLYDAILIKDNHLVVAGLSPADAVRRARKNSTASVEIEVESAEEALDAARAGAEVIMLDNFSSHDAALAVGRVRAEFPREGETSPLLEISGGVTIDSVRAYAEAGADRISVGALTHSARALDISLDIVAG